MATVYITTRLTSDVRDIIDAMRNAEVKTDCPDLENSSINVDAADLFHYCAWGKEHMHLVNQIPKEWLHKHDRVSFEVISYRDSTNKRALGDVYFGAQTRTYGPPSRSWGSNYETKITVDQIHTLDFPGIPQLRERLIQLERRIEIIDSWAKIKADVIGFLDKCKSLNEAIKLLPNIKLYIPPEDLRRVEYKPESTKVRREKIVAEVGLRADELTAAAMAAKLSGAFA